MTTTYKQFVSMAALAVLVLPALVFACTPKSNVWSIDILKGPLVSCTGTGNPARTLPGGTQIPAFNPCLDVCDLVCTSANVVYFGIGVVIWIVLPIMFAWGGLALILSRGNVEGTGAAKKMLTGAAIGLLIVLCAYLIVYTFVKIVGISGIGGFSADAPACQILPAGAGAGTGTPSGGAGAPPGPAPQVCLLAPLTPITDPLAQAMENGQTVVWNSSDPNVQKNLNAVAAAYSKMQAALARPGIGVSTQVTSVYRPLAYQKHLFEIYQRSGDYVLNPTSYNTVPACAPIIANLEAEERKHGICVNNRPPCLVAAPSACAPHVRGIGIDIVLSGGTIGYSTINPILSANKVGLIWRALPNDDPHFELVTPPYTGCAAP